MNTVKPSYLLELRTKRDNSDKEEKLLLESDYANLKHMCDQLEVAIKEGKNKHCNRIVRYVK